VVPGRSRAVVTDWSVERARSGAPGAGRALDPFRSYDTALRARLPTASVALDPFHAIKLCQNTIDAVNRRVQQDTLGHRGRRGEPLYGIRRVLLRGAERHTLRSCTRLAGRQRSGQPGERGAERYPRATPCLRRQRPRIHRIYQSDSNRAGDRAAGCCAVMQLRRQGIDADIADVGGDTDRRLDGRVLQVQIDQSTLLVVRAATPTSRGSARASRRVAGSRAIR